MAYDMIIRELRRSENTFWALHLSCSLLKTTGVVRLDRLTPPTQWSGPLTVSSGLLSQNVLELDQEEIT